MNLTGGNLDVTGKTLSFIMDSSTSTASPMLVVSVGNLDNVDAASNIDLSGLPTGLNEGDSVTLIQGASSGTPLNILGRQVGRRTFDITQANATADVVATLQDIQSFQQYQAGNSFNVNLISGAGYLDYLDSLAGFDPAFMAIIETAFNEADALGGWNAAMAKQQLYGAYSAYANQALSSDMNRFRRRWQGQNRSFFDASLFGSLSTASADAGIASDSGLASPAYGARDCVPVGQSRVWAGGFGTWAKQNNKSNLSGYKYDSQGAVLGYEYTLGNLNLGFAAAYSRGDLKVDDLSYKNEADVLNLALYGAYVHDSGLYAEGGLGYGHAWNDNKVHSIATPGGTKKAKYGSDAFTADLELGYIARLPQDFNLIPSVGVEYTYLKNGSWTEKVNNPALIANRFASSHDHGIDIPVGLRFNKMFRFGFDGGFVVPEVRAAYVYSANKNRTSITSGFAGAPGGFKQIGVDPGRSHWRIGAGLSGRVNSRVDFRVDYDFETRSGFKGHNLNASVGLSF